MLDLLLFVGRLVEDCHMIDGKPAALSVISLNAEEVMKLSQVHKLVNHYRDNLSVFKDALEAQKKYRGRR